MVLLQLGVYCVPGRTCSRSPACLHTVKTIAAINVISFVISITCMHTFAIIIFLAIPENLKKNKGNEAHKPGNLISQENPISQHKPVIEVGRYEQAHELYCSRSCEHLVYASSTKIDTVMSEAAG